ncbi:unnamed protein product [Phyllotreta striolata]|uniref:Uncharacterized protein n=1 Tax=Phyllotreta striolata TaxID=444603 RepID=A0A9N9TZ00_PHYSR|nr:unnamed protein product [Phyllotreta striolata]
MCSYCSNIYLILKQVNDLSRVENRSFATVGFNFMCSIGLTISKIIILTISAEKITRNSKGFIKIILDVPNEFYNTSLKRLLTQIQFNPATLTGGNMFKITKSSLMHITASVITYDVVLNEFSE